MIADICLALGCIILGYVFGRLMLVSHSFKNMHTWVDAITRNSEAYDAHIKYISDIRKSRIKVTELMEEVENHLKDLIDKK